MGGQGSHSQSGLVPPSVLVLVFLLVFFNFIILRGCKSLLERRENSEPAAQTEGSGSTHSLETGPSGPRFRGLVEQWEG